MFHTVLCELLEIQHPILQGAMGPNDTSALAIAVCRAGGLGTISSSTARDPYAETRRQIQDVAEQTTSTFAVNQVVKAPEAAERIRAVIDERKANSAARQRLKVVVTSGGSPKIFASVLKESGVLHVHVVPTVPHALKAAEAGCDALIAEGYESGGHVAYDPVYSLVLIPAVVDVVKVPVIAAGGFSDGRGLAAALMLGASGIQMATRFYLSREAGFAHPRLQQALLRAQATDTVVVPGIYGPNRHWKNQFAERLCSLIASGAPHETIEAAKAEGEQARLSGEADGAGVPIGMVVGRVNQVERVADIIKATLQEAVQCVRHVEGYLRVATEQPPVGLRTDPPGRA